jgi:hypothetical protein
MSGPVWVHTGETCTWTGYIYGGTTPYTYSRFKNNAFTFQENATNLTVVTLTMTGVSAGGGITLEVGDDSPSQSASYYLPVVFDAGHFFPKDPNCSL